MASDRDGHIRRAGSDYRDAFLQRLPQGPAWAKHALDSVLWQTVDGLCNYWGSVDGRAADLLETESDPRKTVELLPDWERNWGLPDPCLKDRDLTIEERQIILVSWMTLLGGQSRDFFLWAAHTIGYDYITVIGEHSPFMFGVSWFGDTRVPENKMIPRWEIGAPEMRFYWNIHVGPRLCVWWRFGQAIFGVDPHCNIDLAEDLECVLNRWKPAHTQIVFEYEELQKAY